MHRWFEPSAAGLILFVFFLAFQGLCGETTQTTTNIVQSDGRTTVKQPVTVTTFGAPTVLETIALAEQSRPMPGGIRVYWLRVAAVIVIGWSAAMALGRLMFDGGLRSRSARTLLPPRRHPALLLLAYIAAIPVLALPGALIDMLHNGVRGLFSPDGPSAYPLLVLMLIFFGLPVVAIFLAVRRVLDRRSTTRPFETNAPPKPELEWPF
jgi:hypothetical protein